MLGCSPDDRQRRRAERFRRSQRSRTHSGRISAQTARQQCPCSVHRLSGGGTFAWRSRAATGCESALARMAGKIPRAVGHFANAVSLKSDEADDDQTIKKDFHSHSTMKRLSLIVLFAFATLNTPFAQPQPGAPNPAQASPNPAQASPNPAQAWWAHVQFLADDKMAGRDTGSPEHRKAADYVAA